MILKQQQNTDMHPKQTPNQEFSGVKYRLSSSASVASCVQRIYNNTFAVEGYG